MSWLALILQVKHARIRSPWVDTNKLWGQESEQSNLGLFYVWACELILWNHVWHLAPIYLRKYVRVVL